MLIQQNLYNFEKERIIPLCNNLGEYKKTLAKEAKYKRVHNVQFVYTKLKVWQN